MSWEDVLDELEVAVAQQRSALAEGRVPVFGAPPSPAELGPVPGHLAERARALLAEADAVTAELATATATAARQLRALRTPAPGGSSFIDARA